MLSDISPPSIFCILKSFKILIDQCCVAHARAAVRNGCGAFLFKLIGWFRQ